MSGLSLREQLLQAGLVTEKQAKQAEQPAEAAGVTRATGTSARRDREQSGGTGLPSSRRPCAAKAARDAELNRKREEKAAAKARWAEIRQIVEQHRIAKPESDDYFNFVLGKKIGRVAVDAALRDQHRQRRASPSCVATGATNCCRPMPASASGTRTARRRVHPDPSAEVSTPVDEAYKDFVVPDDLMW